jgi:hypothetical protein
VWAESKIFNDDLKVREEMAVPEAQQGARIKHARNSAYQDQTICERAQLHCTLQLEEHKSGCFIIQSVIRQTDRRTRASES